MAKKTPIVIHHKKLGKQGVDGLAYCEEREVYVDERLKGLNYLETIIHEVMHVQNPKWNEITVAGRAKELSKILWDLNFRKVDNSKE